ncbi:RNA-binding cell elongation regulator Jag/EloR [uncultured Fenollaria sp.]|uniref:RNA-binding cell elongation regulator Jag/EloR n=1 Tax=uncultured Fenollaria sp. TaxID=1686315 RepID=UPI0025E09D4B|nr:RNA-binding cell elongation regulator Jag/EloR [uncultured Fenollaria sp.]
MKSRFEAKTIEDAIIKAETELGMSRDAFTVDVINEDSKGFLGIGAKDAVIEVIYEEVAECHCGCEDHEHNHEHEHHDHDHDHGNGDDAEHIIILKNFLDEFFRLFEVKASYKIDESDDMIKVLINGESSDDTSKLIGKKGAVLDSLNTIAQIQLNKSLAEFKRLYIDVGDYRKKRQEKVRELAIQGCERARKYGTKVSLEYMTSYDRRIVHETLAGIEGVKTFSEGNEPHRRVCIIAK